MNISVQARRLRDRKRDLGITTERLAAESGVSYSHLSKVLYGIVSLQHLAYLRVAALAKVLQMSVDELMREEEDA